MGMFKKKHKNVKLRQTGICIHENLPFLVGSPDVLFFCKNWSTQGKNYFIGEVKCLYRLGDIGIAATDLLEYLGENKKLKTSHAYYFQ